MIKKLKGTFQKEKKFGWLISGIIIAVCLYRYLKAGEMNTYGMIAAGGVLFISLILPAALAYPLFLWEKLGYYLALFNTVLLLSAIYILIFVPLSILFRLTRRDLLGTRLNKTSHSYWESRQKAPATFKQQF